MTLRFGPKRPCRRAAAVIFVNDLDERYELPFVDFGTNRFEESDVFLSNIQQPIPFELTLRLRANGRADFSWKFDLEGKSFFWLAEALRFQHVLSRPTKVIYRDWEDGLEDVAVPFGEPATSDTNPEAQSFVDRVLAVQLRTKSVIHIPKGAYASAADREQLELIEMILATGRPSKAVVNVAFPVETLADLQSLKELLNGKRLEVTFEMQFLPFLGDRVALGPAVVWCPEVLVHPDDREKFEMLGTADDSYPQVIRLVAAPGNVIQSRYVWWDQDWNRIQPQSN
jgi:hypothetical protein